MRSRNGRRNLVALYGFPGSGKDTVASFLAEYGWTRIAFADPVREMLYALNPIVSLGCSSCGFDVLRVTDMVSVNGYDAAKRMCPEIRELLQRLGTEAGRNILGSDVWVNAAEAKIRTVLESKLGKVVVTDMRFPNEHRMACDMGAVIVKVSREGCGGLDHASEQHYGSFNHHIEVYNNGSLDDLRTSVQKLVETDFGRITDTMSVDWSGPCGSTSQAL